MRISCIKLLFFVISSVKSEMKSMQFQRVSSFDGKECQGTEIAFSRENVSRRIMCLIECSKYENCQSFFHAQSTGRCTGCTKIYGTYTNPTGTASGTTYYSQTVSECPAEWFKIGTSCYTITDVMTFEEGVESCRAMNAHPVVIETVDENNSLKSKLSSLPSIANEVVEDAYFTAYTDIAIEDTWVVNGTNETFFFLDWGEGEPDGGTGENCMAFHTTKGWLWVDLRCSKTLKTICERDSLN